MGGRHLTVVGAEGRRVAISFVRFPRVFPQSGHFEVRLRFDGEVEEQTLGENGYPLRCSLLSKALQEVDEWGGRHGHVLAITRRARPATDEENLAAQVWAIRRRIGYCDARANHCRERGERLEEVDAWLAGVRIGRRELLTHHATTPSRRHGRRTPGDGRGSRRSGRPSDRDPRRTTGGAPRRAPPDAAGAGDPPATGELPARHVLGKQ